MKFSENWLREWVNPQISTAELAEKLTMAGLEVDAIAPAAPTFDGVVVARVLSVTKHPDAEKLKVCGVDAGQPQPLQIVCGAPNVRQGMYVPLAMVGAYLPGDIRINHAKLRGVESEGMLCSAKELGLAEQAQGLMDLPDDAQPGQDIRQYLGLDDNILELSLTPNRSDCLGIAGVAREVGVINSCDVTPVTIRSSFPSIDTTFPVTVEAVSDCPRYLGRVIRNIRRTVRTPLWIQERLRRSGLRSIDPVVDVTNYVMLELGQPMHAFDLEKLQGGITVRHARQGERIKLLDGQDITLQSGTLVIADDSSAIAMAGIMGGLDSAVGQTTCDIFLESAFFSPMAIAGRARSYGLHTDSSHRFERGVDPFIQRDAMERATELLLNIVGGEAGPITEVCHVDELPVARTVNLRRDRISRMLGIELDDSQVEEYLRRLGMQLEPLQSGWRVSPPRFRFDIAIEADLIEELGRIYGYSRLPTRRPRVALTMQALPEGRVDLRRIRRLMTDRGYNEAVTYSFTEPELHALITDNRPSVGLANPLSAELSVMRASLWPGLLQALAYNMHRQQERVRLFESGINFILQDNDIIEKSVIAAVATGPSLPEQWGESRRDIDFYDIKGDLEALLALTGRQHEFIFTVDEAHPALHPGQSAVIRHADRIVGHAGVLHPEIQKKQGINGRVVLFELDLAVICGANIPQFELLSRYPSVRRDLAIVVDETVSAKQVFDCIEGASGGLLRNFQLFDVYTGKGIDSGKKSLALTLIFQDSSRTLMEEDVNTLINRVLENLSQELNATLRE
jgi:phenylalanyl-tRNA synthetase beta chain